MKRLCTSLLLLLLLLLLFYCNSLVEAAAVKITRRRRRHCHGAVRVAPWTTTPLLIARGGGHDSLDTNTTTLENYVAAMEQRDASNNEWDSTLHDSTTTTSEAETTCSTPEDTSMLGIKEHKKSNAVGDPDSDSDDDDDSDTEEWQDLDDFISRKEDSPEQQEEVQVQVEVVSKVDDDDNTKTSNSGGVRLGRKRSKKKSSPSTTTTTNMYNAWLPHVYFPPSDSALQHLQQQARTVNAFGKTRLDRRTLYAGLLLEWQQFGNSRRKFLNPTSSQTLQAALSLATQPSWRQAAPQSSGITLYTEESTTTLAMQETIAMALVSTC